MPYETNSAEAYCREFEHLRADRSTWENHWEEIADYIYPSMRGTFSAYGYRTPGEKKTEKQLDATPQLALNTFASVMNSLLTPENATWHRLKTSNKDLNKIRRVKLYFDELNTTLQEYRRLTSTNFAGQNHQDYLGLGAFGTAALFIDKNAVSAGLRYRSIHLGELYIRENHQGLIDTAYRHFELTVRQAIQDFDKDNLPEQIRNLETSSPERKFWFLHCVKPRKPDYTRLDYRAMPFESTYISMTDKMILREGGYRTFPYAISRYVQGPCEVYGRAPAMIALPAVKTLNAEKAIYLAQGHRAAEPVILAPDDGVLDGVNIRPGDVNYGAMNMEGRALLGVLPSGDIAITETMMDAERQIVNDVFLVRLFSLLMRDPNATPKTAAQVLDEVRQQGVLVAPTVGRQQSERLGPMIEREVDVLADQRVLPLMPPELLEARGEYQIEYENPMSRMMRAEEATGFLRTLDTALIWANASQDPSVLDWLDGDTAIPEIAEINGMPTRWVRDTQAVFARRAGRAQEQERAMQAQEAPGQAALISANAKAATAAKQ